MGFIQLNEKTLKNLHNVQIEILDEIVRICNENNLEYFLVGGTLLGAVRHQGFIPWDDDLDIAMNRKDYEKFLSLCKNELNDKYRLDCDKTNDKYWLTFAKIRKKNTLFLENSLDGIDTGKEIFVDIFPLDDIKKPFSVLNRVRLIFVKIVIDALFYKRGITKDINVCRRPKMTKFFSKFSFKFLHKFQHKIVTLSNPKKSNYLVSFSGCYAYKKEVFLKNDFYPTKTLKFEEKSYKVPNNYKKYLKNIYGDYMKLPPKNERVNHSALDIKFEIE